VTDTELRAQLEGLGAAASAGCGLVYELYAERLSEAVDRFAASLPESDRTRVLAIARADFDYYDADECEAGRKASRAAGECKHYLDAWTCPAGCFEGD
jgi:hypothetical protein